MSEAQRLALALTGRINEVGHLGRTLPRGLGLFGVGQSEVMARLSDLERRTKGSVWNLQPTLTFDPEDAAYAMVESSRARGVAMQMVVPPRTLQFHPLLTSFSPNVWLGPVLLKCLIVDGRLAVLRGPDTVDGATTAWVASEGEFLQETLALWHATAAESRPALSDGTGPPLNARQLSVARAVVLGRTDTAIARLLSISERTVARDVAAILAVTEAHSRSEAILNILGRGRQSRT